MQDSLEPVLLFTKPLVPVKLAAAGIVPPVDSSMKDDTSTPPYRFHGLRPFNQRSREPLATLTKTISTSTCLCPCCQATQKPTTICHKYLI